MFAGNKSTDIQTKVLLNQYEKLQLKLENREKKPFSHNLLTLLLFGAESRGGDITSSSN